MLDQIYIDWQCIWTWLTNFPVIHLVALITVYIAWQQWRTNRNQFRLHLFDRRIAVYEAVMELAACIARKGTVTQEELREYARKTRETSFVFDDTLQAYCDVLLKKAGDLSIAYAVTLTPSASSYQQMVESYGELLPWFIEYVDKGAKPRFERFLRIRE